MQWLINVFSGGSKGALPPPTAEKFLNFMQFFENLAKSYVGALPWRLGAPSYGEHWIRPWFSNIIFSYQSELNRKTLEISFLFNVSVK